MDLAGTDATPRLGPDVDAVDDPDRRWLRHAEDTGGVLVTNHVLSGAFIGRAAPGPVSAFAAGVASHFALDAVPHWGNGKPIDEVMHVAVPGRAARPGRDGGRHRRDRAVGAAAGAGRDGRSGLPRPRQARRPVPRALALPDRLGRLPPWRSSASPPDGCRRRSSSASVRSPCWPRWPPAGPGSLGRRRGHQLGADARASPPSVSTNASSPTIFAAARQVGLRPAPVRSRSRRTPETWAEATSVRMRHLGLRLDAAQPGQRPGRPRRAWPGRCRRRRPGRRRPARARGGPSPPATTTRPPRSRRAGTARAAAAGRARASASADLAEAAASSPRPPYARSLTSST